MKDELEEAVFKDLGREHFATEIAEIMGSISQADWDIKNLDRMMKDKYEQTELINFPGKTLIHYEPLGVVGIYGAWNFPYTVTI